MFAGLSKRQWVVVCMVLLAPLLLNAVGMWHQIKREQLLEAIETGVYNRFGDSGVYYNPWPPVLGHVGLMVFVGGLCWLAVFATTRSFWRRLKARVRQVLGCFSAILGVLLAGNSIALSSTWWWEFNHDYFVSGTPGSWFVRVASLVVVLPATSLAMAYAFTLSDGAIHCGNEHVDQDR